MKVVSLYDLTGNILKPWAAAGYDCMALDLQHQDHKAGGIDYYQWDAMAPSAVADAMTCIKDAYMVFAWPPCTDLAISGARWFKGKGLYKLSEAIHMFAVAAELGEAAGPDARYLIENPVSTISTYWRPPDYTFHPAYFTGFELTDNYTKKTCLWTNSNFVMPRPCMETTEVPDNRIHTAAPGDARADIRSETPMGFTQAVFEANKRMDDEQQL